MRNEVYKDTPLACLYLSLEGRGKEGEGVEGRLLKSLIFPEKSLRLFTMTENDNQKLDLIMKMIEQVEKRIEQQDKRSDQIVSMIEQQDKRFEQIDKRFEQAEIARKEDRAEWQKAREEDRAEWRRSFEDIKYDLRLDKQKLEKVYEARNQVTVSFSRAFATANAAIAGVIAVMVSMFWNK